MTKFIVTDIREISRIIMGIERYSEENEIAIDKQMDNVNSIFEDFSKKYPKLSLKLVKLIDSLHVKIFINEPSVQVVFTNVCSKINGLTEIGLRSFSEAVVQDSEKFASMAGNIQNNVYLTYNLDFGTETIVLQYDEKEMKVELNYELESLVNPLTPQHQLLAQYALQKNDPKIDLVSRSKQLGFIDTEDKALFEWEDEFYPKMLE